MKSRLAASIKLFSAGKCWINAHSTVSSRSILPAFDRYHDQIDCSYKVRFFESLNRAVHSAAVEDDPFAELGPRKSECSIEVTEKLVDFVDDDASSELDPGILNANKIKLVTEKHDAFLDDDVSSELDPDISELSAKKMKLDDAFSELGPGISDCSAKQIKLVTEKRDPVLKTKNYGRESASKPLLSFRLNAKELFECINKASTTSSTKSYDPVHAPNPKKLYGAEAQPSTRSSTDLCSLLPTDHKKLSSRPLSSESNANDLMGSITKATTVSSTKLPSPADAPTSTRDTKKVSEVEYPFSVSIKNVPSKVGLPELIEAISVFGKVSGASFVTKSDKSRCCNIEFEDADSSRRAILAGKVEVGSNVFQVNSLDAVDLVAVRIKNINENTPDSEIHSICKSVGKLAGLTRTSKNGANAFFYVQNDRDRLRIVEKLNKTVLDLKGWAAYPLTTLPNSWKAPSDEDARHMQRQMLNHFTELKRELLLKQMNLQDLEYLTMSIMHIRDEPPTPLQSGNR